MHILYCLPGYQPAWRLGGPVRVVAGIAEHLVRRGHRVTVFATNTNFHSDLDVPCGRPTSINGVEVWYFAHREILKELFPNVAYLSQSIGFLYSRQMKQALQRIAGSVDLLHTHSPYVYPTYAAAQAAVACGRPYFYNQHGSFNPTSLQIRYLKKLAYLQLIELQILRRATTLIALTAAERRHYRRLGVDTPCQVVPNGIAVESYLTSCERFSGDITQPVDDALMILFLGRLHPNKGAERLLEAFLRIRHLYPQARLFIAGPDDYGIAAKLRACVSQAGADDQVTLLGLVEGEFKKQLLARADLFCLPSAAEGFSVAVLEALASGTAVLLSPQCNFPEVERANAGIVCDADPQTLALRLAQLLSERERLKAMGRCGRRLAEEKYSLCAVADRLLDVYEEGIDRYAIEQGVSGASSLKRFATS